MSIRSVAPARQLAAPGGAPVRRAVDGRRIARVVVFVAALVLLAVVAGGFAGSSSFTASAEQHGGLEGRPYAVDDMATVAKNSGATTLDVLANDTAAIDILTVSDPAHGTTAVVAGEPEQVSYTPDPDYCNDTGEATTDTFTYMINGEDSAAVAITVTCGNDAPPPPAPPPPAPPPPPPPLGPSASVLPTCLGKTATLVAVVGQTSITGTPGDDIIVGADAGETIDGGAGNDLICAGKGNDNVRGSTGNDQIFGEQGKDRLFGDSGRDLLLGGTGDDRLSGGSGDDHSGGGDGQDSVHGDAGNDRLDEITLGGNGRDRLLGGSGNDRVRTAGWSPDRVDCGSGRDSALLDVTDRARRCENVARTSR